MKPYRDTRAEERARQSVEQGLRRALRKAGVRLTKQRHTPAFEAGARAVLQRDGGK